MGSDGVIVGGACAVVLDFIHPSKRDNWFCEQLICLEIDGSTLQDGVVPLNCPGWNGGRV